MGDFYVDDLFFDHPKTLAAGEDAANLCVRGYAWAHRHNTPLIPKAALATLTTKKNVKQLADKLVEVTLWHDEGANYRIHDWEIRNAKMIAKREAGKKGAAAKWKKFHEDQKQNPADADATADDSQMANAADPMPYQPRNQGTKEPVVAIASQQQKPPLAAEPAAAELISQAFEVLYRRRPAATSNPVRHRQVILEGLALEHRETLEQLDWHVPWAPEMLADWLEPVRKPHLSVVASKTQAPEQCSTVLVFHPLGCVCAGQATDRTCPSSSGASAAEAS